MKPPKYSDELIKLALQECENEQIHFIPSIQSHGGLIAFSQSSERVEFVSNNIKEFLNKSPKFCLDKSMEQIFNNQKTVHAIRNIASHQSIEYKKEYICLFKEAPSTPEINLSMFKTEKYFVIEMQINQVDVHSYLNIIANTSWITEKSLNFTNHEELIQKTTKRLKYLTCFDRILVYKFLPDRSGEVVADTSSSEPNSFLGLRFPASDIPQIARDLLLKNTIRVIENVNDPGVLIIKKPNCEDQLDLSLSWLRKSSDIHLQYLRHMGVQGTMNLAIIVDGKLWGVFAFHHKSPKALSPELIHSYILLAHSFSLSLEKILINELHIKQMEYVRKSSEILTINNSKENLSKFWQAKSKIIKDLFPCATVAYILGDHYLTEGEELPLNLLKSFLKLDKDSKKAGLWYCDSIDDIDHPELDTLGYTGVLVLKLETLSSVKIVFLRKKTSSNIGWAGSPDKEIVMDDEIARVLPRTSFKKFIENKKVTYHAWNSLELELARILLVNLDRVARDLEARKIHEDAEKTRLIIIVKELNHRVRNLFSLVKSVSSQSFNEETSITDYTDALERRITALSNASDLLTNDNTHNLSLLNLLKEEFKPHVDHEALDKRVLLNGPEVILSSSLLPIFALVIHELLSNSIKHGALKGKDGKLEVRWQNSGDHLKFVWEEKNLNLDLEKLRPQGFGQKIIQESLDFEFKAKTSIDYKTSGLICSILIPLSALVNIKDLSQTLNNQVEDKSSIEVKKINKKDEINQEFLNILILENNYLIANDLKKLLSTKYKGKKFLCSDVEEAINVIDRESKIEFAILDVNLNNGTSEEVAMKCVEENIPFAYLTGYQEYSYDNFPKAPFIIKPLTSEKLFNTIDELKES